jgi:hypothetical protein
MNESKWESLKLRIQSAARSALYNNRSDGIAIVTIHVVTDYDGTPHFWVVPEAKRVEPSADAQEILAFVVERLARD